MDSYFR